MITSTNFAPPSNNLGTNNQIPSGVTAVPSNATAIFFNPSLSKDTGWLTLDVCREFTRNKCSRADHQCRFAHPTANVEIQNGKVTCCFDSIKGKCQRKDPPCKYLHPPQHLKEQLLQNGRNNLIYRHQQMQFVNSVLQQQQHLLTASPAIYPVVYDANANKAYGANQVALASISDAHYYTTPYIQQGLYYAPYPATQQHLQHQFLPTQDHPPMYPPNDAPINPPPPSGSPTQNEKQQSATSQHLENQNSVTVSSEAPPTSMKDNAKMANSNNKIHFYPALAYNPYANNSNVNNNINNVSNINNNGNINIDNNNNNYYSCQQMAYATIAAPGYPFPIAAAILPRY